MPDPKKIERELQAERDILRARLTELEAQFAPAELVARASSLLGQAGEGAAKTVRRNPGPLAVTGAGLAWMALKAATRRSGPRIAYDETTHPTVTGFRQPRPRMAGFDARLAAADSAIKADQSDSFLEGDHPMTDETHHNTRLDAAKGRLYDTAESQRARIEDGLDGLPDGAKDRIRKAREAAIAVHERAETEAARAAQAARNTAHDNPLLVGGLALAAGAALAMMLPRTQVEDRTIGAHRDRLFDEAERVFQAEKAKLKAAAEDAVVEGQKRVKEALKSDDKVDEAA